MTHTNRKHHSWDKQEVLRKKTTTEAKKNKETKKITAKTSKTSTETRIFKRQEIQNNKCAFHLAPM